MLRTAEPLRTRIWTAQQLLECAERELMRRRRYYRNRVMTRRMTPNEANVELSRMMAIRDWLQKEAERERLL